MKEGIQFTITYSIRGRRVVADIWSQSFVAGIGSSLLSPPGAMPRTNHLTLSASSWEELEREAEGILSEAKETALQALRLLEGMPESRQESIRPNREERRDG